MNYRHLHRATICLVFYGLIQLAQSYSWFSIHPISDYGGCGNNFDAAFYSYLLLILHLLVNSLSISVGENRLKKLYRLFVVLSTLYFVIMLLQLFLANFVKVMGLDCRDYPICFEAKRREKLLEASKDGFPVLSNFATCSHIGEYGYLLWQFVAITEYRFASMVIGGLCSTVIFTISDRKQFYIAFFSYYVMGMLSLYFYPNSGESVAFWCRSSISLAILYILDAWSSLISRPHPEKHNLDSVQWENEA